MSEPVTGPAAPAAVKPGDVLPQRLESCEEGVTRGGEFQPCEKRAVAVRLDPEYGSPYAVCAYHARADLVSLTDIAEAVRADEREQASARIMAGAEQVTYTVNTKADPHKVAQSIIRQMKWHCARLARRTP